VFFRCDAVFFLAFVFRLRSDRSSGSASIACLASWMSSRVRLGETPKISAARLAPTNGVRITTGGIKFLLFQYDSSQNRFQCFYRGIRIVIRYTAKVPSQCEPT